MKRHLLFLGRTHFSFRKSQWRSLWLRTFSFILEVCFWLCALHKTEHQEWRGLFVFPFFFITKPRCAPPVVFWGIICEMVNIKILPYSSLQLQFLACGGPSTWVCSIGQWVNNGMTSSPRIFNLAEKWQMKQFWYMMASFDITYWLWRFFKWRLLLNYPSKQSYD